jgi:hypothetical protein
MLPHTASNFTLGGNMRTFLRIVFIVVVAAVVIGTGIAIFNAGMMQGAAMSGQLSDGAAAPVPVSPYYAPTYRPWGFPGGWCIGLFGFLLLIFLIAGLGRMAFGPRHGWHRGPWGMGRPWGPQGFNGDQVPPFVEDMHRKMHEKMNQPPSSQTPA